jgi:pyruvate/2-oxoglutarate/acetoin dehydrogenase E1 component
MNNQNKKRFVTVLNETLHTLFEEHENVVLIGEDLLDPYGGAFKVSKGLSTAFPERVITSPISEAAIVGIGAGLAIKGFLPIIEIMFGDFTTLAFDQIVNGISKFRSMYNNQIECPVMIRTPMGGGRGYGPTHSQSLEKFFFGIPHFLVLAPHTIHDVESFYKNALLDPRPKLVVENKLQYAEFVEFGSDKIKDFFVSYSSTPFPTATLSLAQQSKVDATIITYGGMVSVALEAAEKLYLEEEKIVEVLVPTMISPFPLKDIENSVRKSGKVLILEEGTKTNGFGAEVACQIQEHLFSCLKAPVKRIASPDDCIPSSKALEIHFLPQVDLVYRELLL